MNTFRKISLNFLFLFLVFSTNAQLVINEVCSKNTSIIEDEFGETADWIELYNNTFTDINLAGYFLSDKEDNPQKWVFPNKIIPAQSYLLIFASKNDLTQIYCHTNFKLSNAGETLVLSDATGIEIDRVETPSLTEDHSFGRLPDGSGSFLFFENPTPEFSNDNNSNYEFAKTPEFTTQQYFYENSATIELICDEPNCTIRFTRDGSIPDENSELYSAPFQIDTTTCIRAITFANDLYPSLASTQTFFCNTMHTLPILTLASEPDNFWEWENGIFVLGPNGDPVYPHFGANFWKDIEIPVHMEFFKNQNLVAKFNVGTKIHGGKAARSKPAKALRLLTDKNFESAGMNYAFFENKNINNYRRLVIRNASGDFNYTHFRDAYLHRYFINENLDLDVVAHQPIVVYVNGIYWGVMNLREKVDQYYLKGNYGMEKDSIDLLEEDLVVIEGSKDEYLANYEFLINHDLSIPANFEIAEKYFDLNNLADYFIVQTYVNNTDFPNNNIKYWQPKKEGGKWRYILFDMDVGMGRYGWTVAHYDNFNWRLENADSNKFIKILKAYFENKNYRNYFINRYADLMNTIFTPENFARETENTIAEIEEEMKRHFVRWTWPGYDIWQEERLPGLFTFIEKRPDNQREFVRQYFELENEVELQINTYPEGAGLVKINTITPEDLPWKGYYYNGAPVTLTIIPNNGFTFRNWESVHTILAQNPNETISYNFEKDDEITAYFEAEYKGLNLSASPNPFQNNIELEFTLEKISTVEIHLYDNLGRLLQSFPKEIKNAGTQSTALEIRNLNKGIYIISLQTEDGIESVKVVH
jgi:hypothetical protein